MLRRNAADVVGGMSVSSSLCSDRGFEHSSSTMTLYLDVGGIGVSG